MEEMRGVYRVLVGNNLEVPGVDGRTILSGIFRNLDEGL
jgi:hypothetical protein